MTEPSARKSVKQQENQKILEIIRSDMFLQTRVNLRNLPKELQFDSPKIFLRGLLFTG